MVLLFIEMQGRVVKRVSITCGYKSLVIVREEVRRERAGKETGQRLDEIEPQHFWLLLILKQQKSMLVLLKVIIKLFICKKDNLF